MSLKTGEGLLSIPEGQPHAAFAPKSAPSPGGIQSIAVQPKEQFHTQLSHRPEQSI